jgi:hypothetical protein
VECSTVTLELNYYNSETVFLIVFLSVERFWIKLYFDKFLAMKICVSLRKGDIGKINCNHDIMKGEDLKVCSFKYCSN